MKVNDAFDSVIAFGGRGIFLVEKIFWANCFKVDLLVAAYSLFAPLAVDPPLDLFRFEHFWI